MSTYDYRNKGVIGEDYAGVSGTPAMGKSGSSYEGGWNTYRAAYLPRTGFFLRPGTFSGLGVSEIPWTGQSLSAYGKCTGAPNANTWKRFANVQVKMTCVPDPATGSSASPPSNPGTGTSVHDYQANVGKYYGGAGANGKVVTVNSATTGSGQDARTSAPFGVYTISDSLSVTINTDIEVEVTETILLGYTDGVTNFPGTVYTITLYGHWWNGRLASDVATEAWGIFNSNTGFVVTNPYGGGLIIARVMTKQYDGTVVQMPGIPGGHPLFTHSGIIPNYTFSSALPSDFGTGSGLWASAVNYPFWGYITTPPDTVDEIHEFFAFNGVAYGPFRNPSFGGIPAGKTYAWTINKYTIAFDGTVTAAGTVTRPTVWANDRLIGEPDPGSSPTQNFYIGYGDMGVVTDGFFGPDQQF